MLGDPTCFTAGNIRIANGIKQGRLTMIDMSEDRDHRRSAGELGGILLEDHLPPQWHLTDVFNSFLFLFHLGGLKTKLRCHDSSGVKVDGLINTRHDTIGHQNLNDLNRAVVQQRG